MARYDEGWLQPHQPKACYKRKGCDCRRVEWNINSQLLDRSESLRICSFWKVTTTNKKYFSFCDAGSEAWRCRWHHLFVRCGWMIINTVSAQLLPVAYVRTTQGDIVRMMEGVYKCSSLTNRVAASSLGSFPVCKCCFHKVRRHLKTIILSELH